MRSKKKLIIILSIMIAVIGGIIAWCSITTTKNESNLITSDGVCSDEVYNDISKAMNTVLFSEDYNNLSLNEKKERMLTVLYELEDKGLILKDSIFYEDGTICFQYPDGFEGNVRLEDRLSGFSGNADTNKYATSWNNSCNEKGAMPKIDFLDSSYPFKEENIKKLNLSAKYMFGLCDENDTSSKDYHDFHRFLTYYKTNQENWNSQYLKTDIDEYCTVEDFKTGLLGYDIVFIELHGTIYKKQPIICTYEEFNNDKYRNDRSHLIIDKDSNGKDCFLIKPSFFEKYYGNNKLNDSIIWIGSCHGYQYDDLAKTFENCGADAVIGYNESVLTDYDYALHNSFVYSLMHGDTVAESLKFSKGYWKSSDKEWYYAIDSSNKNFFNLIKNYDITLHKSAEAKVNFNGLNAKLIKLVEDKTNKDRLVQMIIYIIESEDTSKLLTDKEVEIAVSNSNLKCVNAKAKTNKEGIVMFEFNTNMQDLVAKTDITLHIEGYQDFTISNYGINTQGNIVNEAEAFMNPIKITEPATTPTEFSITAVDLIDKTIPEIISLMNGEYQIIQTEMGGYYNGTYSGIFYIQNQSVFPGMEFYSTVTFDESVKCNPMSKYPGEEIQSDELRRNLEAGKYALDVIQVNKSGKVSNTIQVGMDYKSCSKALGDFDCIGGNGGYLSGSIESVSHTYNEKNAEIILHFFDIPLKILSDLTSSKISSVSSEEMKSYNPKLENVVIRKPNEIEQTEKSSNNFDISEDELKNIMSSYGNICAWEYADYDGNGMKEAFAIVGKNSMPDYYISDSIQGVYFISAKGEVKELSKISNGLMCSIERCTEYEGKKFFSYNATAGGSSSQTYLFSVKNGNCYELSISGTIVDFYNDNSKCYATISEFLPEGGHIWAEYELIYDKSSQEFSIGNDTGNIF